MLNKEKAKRMRARQKEYEGKYGLCYLMMIYNLSDLFLAIFSLKKSLKEYQKRLIPLENAPLDNRTTVCVL